MDELTDRELDVRVAEEIMGLVPCTAESHITLNHPRPCHAQPDSPDQGGETRCYSSDISAAMEVRDAVKIWLFSRRRAFKLALQHIISERLQMSGGLIHPEEIILHFTAKDVCLAALSVKDAQTDRG